MLKFQALTALQDNANQWGDHGGLAQNTGLIIKP